MLVEKNDDPVSLIHLNMRWSRLNKISEIQEKRRLRTRTDAVNYLIDLAVKFIEKVESVPEAKLADEMEEIHSQLKEGGVVDYVSKMSGRDLKNLYKIITEEYHFRTEK